MERHDIIEGKTNETWMHVCEQAAIEQNPHKLLELVNEINRMLEEKENCSAARQEQGR